MKNYRLKNEENETHISWTRADKEARVYTLDHTVQRRIESIMKDYPELCRIVKEEDFCGNRCVTYALPIKLVNFRRPNPQRILTLEQKTEMAERLKMNRNRVNAE